MNEHTAPPTHTPQTSHPLVLNGRLLMLADLPVFGVRAARVSRPSAAP